MKTAKITIIAEGFVIDWQRKDVTNTRVEWTAVKRATAYKRDLFAYDLICLASSFDPGYGVELDEEMEGFSEFWNEFEINISGSIPHATWFESEVAAIQTIANWSSQAAESRSSLASITPAASRRRPR